MARLTTVHATIVDALRHHARVVPDRTAVRFVPAASDPAALTFAELDGAATRVAAALRRDIGAGDRVLMIYPPGLDFVTAFFGILYAGAVAVPLVPPRRQGAGEAMRALLANAEPSAIATCSEMARRITEVMAELGSPLALVETDRLVGEGEAAGANSPDALAVLQYTSGSTGSPRGVMIPHGHIARNAQLLAKETEVDARSVWVNWAPHFHDLGLFGGICTPLYAGITTVLMPPAAFVTRPLRWLEVIAQHGGTISVAPNFAYDLCVRQIRDQDCDELDLSCWTVAACGAEPIRMETMNAFAERFARFGFRREALWPCYGLAEATLFVCGGPSAQGQTAAHVSLAALREHRLVPAQSWRDMVAVPSCGRASPEHRLVAVDAQTLRRCPPDVVGEIWIDGSTTGLGYWRNPAETSRVFGARLASGEGPFLRTGDLGFVRDGTLHVTGRIKEMMILRGQNVYPQDLEATARAAAPEIAAAAAFALAGAATQRAGMAIEQPKQMSGDPAAVLAAVRDAVWLHDGVELECVIMTRRRALPKTSSGKLQRARIASMLVDGTLPVLAEWRAEAAAEGADSADAVVMMIGLAHQAPSEQIAAVKRYLDGLLRSLLGLTAADLDGDGTLMSMGVTSLGIMRLRRRIESDLMLMLDADLLWQEVGVAELASRLRNVVLASPLCADAQALETLAAEIAGMSDEDVARELAEHAA
jgi:acyl-CoA synthetase (AMP-forming)/AMP-acid ligase II